MGGLLEFWIELIDADADFAEKVAKAELRTGVRFHPNMYSKPEDMAGLVVRSKTEDVGRYFKLLLELGPFVPKLTTLLTLTPQDKLQLSLDFRRLLSKYKPTQS